VWYVILFIGALIGVWIESVVSPIAENHPWTVTIVIAVLAVVVGGTVWLLTDLSGLAVVGILLGAAFWGLLTGWDARDNYLTPYCAYSAESQAQIDECLSKINSGDVDKLDTPAARFARGEIDCGPGSGSLCADNEPVL
jgi:hypothetical protein